jgi:hypothetical protein
MIIGDQISCAFEKITSSKEEKKRVLFMRHVHVHVVCHIFVACMPVKKE